jgi:long-chain acyl-CoA synthetase
MIDSFLSLVRTRPDAAALVDAESGRITTREQLLARAEEISALLTGAGFAAGDAVAVQLPNSVDFVATFLAALMLRLVVFPVDRDAPEGEVGGLLAHFAIRGLVWSPDRKSFALSAREIDNRPAVPEGTCLVKLTSGSTGKPRGIVTSERNLVADCTNICSSMGIRPDDVNLGAIPFSHSYGFSNLVMPLLVQGTPVVYSNDYLPQALLEATNRHRCTVVPLIPMVFEHLTTTAHGSFESVRTFLSAGAPLSPSTSRRFRERFGLDIHTFYGCSECGGITYDRAGGAVERGTVGQPLDGVRLEAAGSRLSVESASVASGYLTAASFFEPFPRGRFVTDDLIELRGAEVAITGRRGDQINVAGKKVNPREVEAVIAQIEGVREVKVYGEPAGARGEIVAAAIVATPDLTREQIRTFCSERLSPFKVPRIIKLIDALPVDERGKVKRTALAQL